MASPSSDLKTIRHPDLVAAIKQRPFPDLTNGDPNATLLTIRKNRAAHLAGLRHLYRIPGPIPDEVKEKEIEVEVRDGEKVRVRVYEPVSTTAAGRSAKSDEGRPLIIMFHEGGWSMGDLTDEDQSCRLFASQLGAICLNVEYRLAPEHPFPKGVEDAYDVVKWAARTASPDNDALPADPSKGFVVGGASAGGNLAAVICQLARDENLSPPLTGQWLVVPALLAAQAVPQKWETEMQSRYESVSDPVLGALPPPEKRGSQPDMLMKALKYDPYSPLFSPLLHENLRDLPPAFLQVGGLDPLRDEGVLYEKVLREEGGKTRLEVYEGFGHMFWTNWPEMKRSGEFWDDAFEEMKWLLGIKRGL